MKKLIHNYFGAIQQLIQFAKKKSSLVNFCILRALGKGRIWMKDSGIFEMLILKVGI